MGKVNQLITNGQPKIAVLIDPDKWSLDADFDYFLKQVETLCPGFIFVGGSTVEAEEFDAFVSRVKAFCSSPLILFPGSSDQISEKADGILFLSLLSGRNPDFLIGHQVKAAYKIKAMGLEPIPTGYLLVEGNTASSVAYVSQTTPIPRNQDTIASRTAIAGEMLGMNAIFLDAGSGAELPVPENMIRSVKQTIDIPLIIGGGIRSVDQIISCFDAGAEIVVIGNHFEENIDFLLDVKLLLSELTPNTDMKKQIYD